MRRPKAPSPVAELLPGILAGLSGAGRPSIEAIEGIWKRLVGEKATRHSWPRRLVSGRLIVEVEDSGWMYTLNLKRTQLLQGLIELLGAHQVKNLSFRIGERKDAQA